MEIKPNEIKTRLHLFTFSELKVFKKIFELANSTDLNAIELKKEIDTELKYKNDTKLKADLKILYKQRAEINEEISSIEIYLNAFKNQTF